MNTNFEHYRIFYYVAKYGNLTKAATVLHTSQPSVTRTIHNLEKNLNCRLFERSKVGMKLTPEGEVFYEYIAAGCAQFFKAESNLSDMLSLENGTIYVSATETALHCYLFQAMESFNEQYPNVHFKILNNSTIGSKFSANKIFKALHDILSDIFMEGYSLFRYFWMPPAFRMMDLTLQKHCPGAVLARERE